MEWVLSGWHQVASELSPAVGLLSRLGRVGRAVEVALQRKAPGGPFSGGGRRGRWGEGGRV